MTKSHFRAAIAVLALGLSAGAASAADLTRPAPMAPAAPYPETIVAYGFNWTGGYVGANLGYRWVENAARSNRGGSFRLDSSSIAGGLQAGYLLQSGGLVYGAEIDAMYGDNARTRAAPGGRVSSTIDWSGSARGRLGWAFDRVLVYGTAGVGIAGFESTGRGGGKTATKTDTLIGWTAGGGLEYAISKNVSVRGEYLFSDYGRNSVSYGGTGVSGNKQDITSHLARMGVNFKF
jgi:outer membrane immunogenic protein